MNERDGKRRRCCQGVLWRSYCSRVERSDGGILQPLRHSCTFIETHSQNMARNTPKDTPTCRKCHVVATTCNCVPASKSGTISDDTQYGRSKDRSWVLGLRECDVVFASYDWWGMLTTRNDLPIFRWILRSKGMRWWCWYSGQGISWQTGLNGWDSRLDYRAARGEEVTSLSSFHSVGPQLTNWSLERAPAALPLGRRSVSSCKCITAKWSTTGF